MSLPANCGIAPQAPPLPPPPPSPAPPIAPEVFARRSLQRVAVATLWDSSPSYSCAVMHWCQHAQRFADLLVRDVGVASAELVMLLTHDHAPSRTSSAEQQREQALATLRTDCPQLRVARVDERLVRAVDSYVARGGCKILNGPHMLYKWWALSLAQYALVVFSDLDVQLLRPEQPAAFVGARWAAGWADAVPADGSTRLLGASDFASPLNGGQWTLAWPDRALYEQGVRVLAEARWNATHGFNGAGTPRELARGSRTVAAALAKTRMLGRNTWGFPFGDCDQGFLFYMLFLVRPVGQPMLGAGARNASSRQCRFHPAALASAPCPHSTRHYYGGLKPWALLRSRANAGRVSVYLNRTAFAHLANCSRCAATFAAWHRTLPPPARIGTHLVGHGEYQRLGP